MTNIANFPAEMQGIVMGTLAAAFALSAAVFSPVGKAFGLRKHKGDIPQSMRRHAPLVSCRAARSQRNSARVCSVVPMILRLDRVPVSARVCSVVPMMLR